MSSSSHTQSALPDIADGVAQLHVALREPIRVGVPPSSSASVRKLQKPRKPKKGCELTPSILRPHVLARDRLRHWTAPFSDTFHSALITHFLVPDIIQLFDVLLVSVEPKTRENYGAGLLRFHQFCDSRKVPEIQRMPASDNLLALFTSSWAGKIATTTLENWISGIHFWHTLHGAPWHGHALLRMSTAGLNKLVPESSKRPRRPPVTLEHMHVLFRALDLSNVFDASVFAIASIAFWSCCRSVLSCYSCHR